MNKDPLQEIFKKGFLLLGVLATAGLAGYGLTYIIVLPSVSPDAFVPTTLETGAGTPAQFGTLQTVFVLLYAFSFLPVSVMFTVKRYSANPYALVFAGCLISISLFIQILNSLPALAAQIYPGKLELIFRLNSCR
ncbi:MAG: hypothetical protein M1546_14745 [Chloroflexi bacterium]|nr:hypothetical protein [Chloroflexota bacterium]